MKSRKSPGKTVTVYGKISEVQNGPNKVLWTHKAHVYELGCLALEVSQPLDWIFGEHGADRSLQVKIKRPFLYWGSRFIVQAPPSQAAA
jgi:hypothetical protein